MIKLEVEHYCHNCSNFEPEVEKPAEYYAGSNVFRMSDTIVRCKNRTLCLTIVEYLEKEQEKSWK